MTDDPFERGPECDFCGLAVEEGETLEPIFVGEPEKPKPHYLSETAERNPGYQKARLFGQPIGMYQALRQALHNCDDITLDESKVVHEVQAVGGQRHMVTEEELHQLPDPTDFERRQRMTKTDKVGVSIKIQPKDIYHEPDAELCDICAEKFRGLGK